MATRGIAISFLIKADPVLGKLIRQVGPIALKPRKTRTVFETLVTSIANQQLSGKAAATILKRFCGLFPGQKFPLPEQVLKLDVETIRSVGFSRPKTIYIHELAQRSVKKEIPANAELSRMSDEEIIECLTEFKGIGRWTVEMLLIFTLGRPDVLPVHDLGIQKGFALAYKKRKLPKPENLLQFGERWRPYRTTASWYLWRALD